MKRTLVQFALYVLVGASATAVDYLSFVLLTRLLFAGALCANPVAYIAGNVVSFLGHRKITFHSRNRPVAEYGRFALVTAMGLSVSQLTLSVLLDQGIFDLFAKAAAVLVSGSFNYAANRFWTFRNRQNPDTIQ